MVGDGAAELCDIILVKSGRRSTETVVFVLEGFDLLIERCLGYSVVCFCILLGKSGRAAENLRDTVGDGVCFTNEIKRSGVTSID